jgi:hypothetical protein
VPPQRADRQRQDGEPRELAVHPQHGEQLVATVHPLDHRVEVGRDLLRGHRGHEADRPAGVAHVGPAGEQLRPEVVVDGLDRADLGVHGLDSPGAAAGPRTRGPLRGHRHDVAHSRLPDAVGQETRRDRR